MIVLPTGKQQQPTHQAAALFEESQSRVHYKQDLPGECVCVLVSVSVCTERGGVGSLCVHQNR